MNLELKTTDVDELGQFLCQWAPLLLEGHQLSIIKQDGLYTAKLFSAEEPEPSAN
jgi:hypothetical protein